jgi:hypothetical protein
VITGSYLPAVCLEQDQPEVVAAVSDDLHRGPVTHPDTEPKAEARGREPGSTRQPLSNSNIRSGTGAAGIKR